MEKVKTVLADIRSKVSNLKMVLRTTEAENSELKEKLIVLEDRLEEREAEIVDFQNKINQLTQQNVIETNASSNGAADQNEQIDALVREIDDCISRLKQ